MRRKVVGEDYVAESLEKSGGDFMRPLVQFATVSLWFLFIYIFFFCLLEEKGYIWMAFGKWFLMLLPILFSEIIYMDTNKNQESAWGTIWTRPGLELKTRSLLNLVMLTALGKWIELGTHVRGAIRNGASEVEIREALLQARYVFCFSLSGM